MSDTAASDTRVPDTTAPLAPLPLLLTTCYLLTNHYSLLTFRRGARFSLTEEGKQPPMWCAPLSPDPRARVFRHPPIAVIHPQGFNFNSQRLNFNSQSLNPNPQ
ncbi:MAG: hypothetical protein LBK25_02325 [Treponema sp.]|jgi:hypothetical protein|nr:hypothetical protein [Treponema sp.]